MARITESLTALMIAINIRHKTHAGIRLTGLPGASMSAPVVVLAGGTGGAKLARGMLDVVGPTTSSSIANTGDDVEIYGAHVSPDPDLVDVLARRPHRRARLGPARRHLRGDGRPARARRATSWFNLGDRDLAIGLERARRLAEGATADARRSRELARALGVGARVLPMCDEPVRTRVRAPGALAASRSS